uniref:PITH domain-containing protein n=1 Tax=Chromera velia CCMP2878 TaxID=1169474 RepID=A0A0K6S9T6_9ALVE|mmetsp:Transcript_34854/g.68811  ORF Transcript_34854/g.68811 Transcript_34854/m.68811 type:complete len:169 (+) Transcript_34854:200-706(+)|eukprot:Cvel_8739.t1-p1 / transcript=Cvel_8739.t1 / gene=Cvel_8739 / organism=Chromera_velia_CCMP2878 / gene_product=PITH domain-containing protein At3g04780, putative / transcript_product=PITH domain-containing protein At3g04780, putative / location=Cvel_scaffold489:2376-7436(+) / protein_length=168 / sequence_SO=supercontig / SO=protein_coding / is_pseudo=false
MADEPLNDQIDKATAECLGMDAKDPLSNILDQPNAELTVQSLDDPQLLLKFAFQSPVKLASIFIGGPAGEDLSEAPRVVKLFTNKMSMGFSDAESDAPIQEFELTEEVLQAGKPVPLRFVKFQNILSLQIFIEDNHGGDITKVSRVEIFGSSGQKMDMKDWKPVKEDQ